MKRIHLKTERLLLRPFRLDDVDDVLAYASPAWGRYLYAVPDPYNRQDAEEFVAATILEPWERRPQFAIELDGHVVGAAGLRLKVEAGRAELGYALSETHWGKGLVPEACQTILQWGFDTFDISKVSAKADARNLRSIRVMEKLGMVQEAYLRKHRYFRGEQVDEVVYALLREDWHN